MVQVILDHIAGARKIAQKTPRQAGHEAEFLVFADDYCEHDDATEQLHGDNRLSHQVGPDKSVY